MTKQPSNEPVVCPACERTVVSRLVDYCQYCEADLPDHLLLSESEKNELKNSIRARLDEERKQRDEKANQRAARGDPYAGDGLGNLIDLSGD